jgi:hypothetical protein
MKDATDAKSGTMLPRRRSRRYRRPSPVVGADDAFEESQTPTTRPPRAESMSRSPGIGQPDSPATPATRRTAISKMRKHELVEELNERGMETGGVVKELRDRLRAAREAGA